MTPSEKILRLESLYDHILDNNLRTAQDRCEYAGFLREISNEIQEYSESAKVKAEHLNRLADYIIEDNLTTQRERTEASDLLDEVIEEVQEFYSV